MNIRFAIFLLTIFMVFVPCYGMQVATELKQSQFLKNSNLGYALLGIFLSLGFVSGKRKIRKRNILRKILGWVVAIIGGIFAMITFSVVIFFYSMLQNWMLAPIHIILWAVIIGLISLALAHIFFTWGNQLLENQ